MTVHVPLEELIKELPEEMKAQVTILQTTFLRDDFGKKTGSGACFPWVRLYENL